MPSTRTETGISRLAWERLIVEFPALSALLEDAPSHQAWQSLSRLKPESWIQKFEIFSAKLSQNRRKAGQKQDGVFYTPLPVARYLAGQTLGMRLGEAETQARRALQDNNHTTAQQELTRIRQLTILDPACGTGVFLLAALETLHAFYRSMAAEFPALAVPTAQEIVSGQLHGMDIDPIAARIAQARLMAWAWRLDGWSPPDGFSDPPRSIRTGDTLGGDSTVAIPAPKDWDIILANPPFVSEVRGQAGRFRALRDNPYYQAKMDLCDAFLAWGIDHLKPGGRLAYVLPEYWTQRSSSTTVRETLWRAGCIQEHWTFPGYCLFPAAPGHHSALLIWQKASADTQADRSSASPRAIRLGMARAETELAAERLQPASAWRDPKSGKVLIDGVAEIELMARLFALAPLLAPDQIQQGIVIPQGRLRNCGSGVFLLDETEIEALGLSPAERQLLKPFYSPGGFAAFRGFAQSSPEQWLIYADTDNRQKIEHDPAYEKLKQHLNQFQDQNTSAFAPYGLHRARQPVWFEDPQKILTPRQVMRPAFAVVPHPAYVSEGFYSVRVSDPWPVVAVLNSKLAGFWFYRQKRKGARLQIDKDVLRAFPQPPGWLFAQTELANLARQLATAPPNEAPPLWQILNRQIYDLYQLTPGEIDCIEQTD